MSLIMKQIYEEKSIEVGIWRTLGAGGVKQKEIKMNENLSPSNLINAGNINDQLRE
jgi:hypothetical protein